MLSHLLLWRVIAEAVPLAGYFLFSEIIGYAIKSFITSPGTNEAAILSIPDMRDLQSKCVQNIGVSEAPNVTGVVYEPIMAHQAVGLSIRDNQGIW